ncbi:hypothetical protein [Paenibacillus sacheonensis]|uniref:Helicase XPB/Ssl2 N-terminal domain-containing protein n=1 Tax=Paenibacillus sacheonensis TaxID=742054 RepID=A0A7X4YMF0_9BACL|nr:hypothetical protein [Paenibacillus sacheonensis]MBM7564508.1 hypothetical protein [Paenibacillus sacheonensis]NBC69067.1 hypothetical protein [Paenibacillus sacheonensis]
MKLADMLSYADIGQLSRIATTYQCECNGNSKNELIQSILSTVNRKEVFEAQIGALKLEDLRFMNSLLFDAREAFSLEELIARVQQSKFGSSGGQQNVAAESPAGVGSGTAPPARKSGTKAQAPKRAAKSKAAKDRPEPESGPRETISRFKQYGWLFNGYAGPERYLFQVPSDLKERFKQSMERRLSAEVVYADEEPFAYRDEQMLIGEDIGHLLTYIHLNEVPLTSEGTMYKRSIVQLLEMFGVKEPLPGKGEWRFGYGRKIKDYPNRFSLLYDYCYYKGWIAEHDELLELTASGKERQALRTTEAPDKLYQFWLRLYKGPIPNIRSLVYWIDKLGAKWVKAETVMGTLTPYVKPFFYDQSETILEQRLIGMMMHLGMLRIGEHAEHGQVIRMTPLGRTIVAGLSLDDEAIVLNS